MGASLNKLAKTAEDSAISKMFPMFAVLFATLFAMSQLLLFVNNLLILFFLFKNYSPSDMLLIKKIWNKLHTNFFIFTILGMIFSFSILVWIHKSQGDNVFLYSLFIVFFIIQLVFIVLIAMRHKFTLVVNRIIFVIQCVLTLLFNIIGILVLMTWE